MSGGEFSPAPVAEISRELPPASPPDTAGVARAIMELTALTGVPVAVSGSSGAEMREPGDTDPEPLGAELRLWALALSALDTTVSILLRSVMALRASGICFAAALSILPRVRFATCKQK